MIKTLKIASLLFATMLVFGTSCSKYENGPKLSLRSKKARVTNTWELTEWIDGSINISENTAGITMTIDKDGSYSIGGENSGGAVESKKGKWEFSSDKTLLILTLDGQRAADKWIITKLKNDELWLEKSQASNTSGSKKYKGLD